MPFTETPKQIYHLACPASPDHFEESPIDILETCFQGTKNVLDLAVGCGARILIASTSGEFSPTEIRANECLMMRQKYTATPR